MFAFNDCISLESIVIPNSLNAIGEQLFGNCRSLKSIVVPQNVTDIMFAAFDGCVSLESVVIANGEVRVWGDVFRNCPSLKKICVPCGTKKRFVADPALKDYGEIIEEMDFTDLNNIIQNY